MVTVDGLKASFSEIADNIYGQCLVIPASKFNKEWNADLTKEGCKIFYGSHRGQAVTFVRLPGQEKPEPPAAEPKEVYKPEPKPLPAHDPSLHWTPVDDAMLINLHESKKSLKEIAEHFPGRTFNGVKGRLQKLREAGKTKRRKRGRPRKRDSPIPTQTPTPDAAPKPGPEPAPVMVRPFPEIWEAAIQRGEDIEGNAEEVYNECVKANIPQSVIQALMNMFAEVQGHVNWLIDNKVDQEQLNKANILFRRHKHVDGEIFVPLSVEA